MHFVLLVTEDAFKTLPMLSGGADLLKWLVGAILGSGAVSAWLTYKIQKSKAAPEANNIAVQGAENAVVAIQKVLAEEIAAHGRTRADRDRLQAEVDGQRDEIEALLQRISGLESALADLRRSAQAVLDRNEQRGTGPIPVVAPRT